MEKKSPAPRKKAPPKAARPASVSAPARRRVAVFFSQDGDGPFVLLGESGIPIDQLREKQLPLILGADQEGEATRSMVRVQSVVAWFKQQIASQGRKAEGPAAAWQSHLRFFENLLAHHPPKRPETTN